ncbi:MAG: hypothetical protein K2G09_03090 [Paramuribaculum sp.]|nr:hypothetical protein [Paramuribaculum sp.]
MKRFLKYIFCLITSIAGLVSCTVSEANLPEIPEQGSCITILAQPVDMLPEIVASRASNESKTAAEKKINRLHIFFFDKNGNFLTPDPQCEESFGAYHIVDLENSTSTAVIVPKNAFIDQENLEGIHIIAIANPICDRADCDHTDCSFKVADLNPDGDICHGDKSDPKADKTIRNLDDLLNWYYRPAPREDITALPDGGMPMMAHFTAPENDAKIFSHEGQIKLPLRALMARVDVVVALTPVETSEDHLFPTLRVTEYGVKNMPDCIPLAEIAEGAASDVAPEEIIKEKTVQVDDRDIIEGQEAKLFTYYTYENVRLRTRDPQEIYPEAVKSMGEDVRQRWKPLVADENASAFLIKGEFTDHQGFRYKAEFTVYLGSDVIDNFEVRRNHCYKNTLSIRGLNNISSDQSYCTFDARVNMDTYNEMYVSILNERHLDAHWCVLPMDIYFLGDAGGECTVTIPEEYRNWIHLDHCSSEGMAPEDFRAGWGCKDYFTEDMWEIVPNTSATVTRSRDRIYFYVDENASTKPRMATVEVYYKSANEDRTDYIEIEQAGLLPFTYEGTTYYMEAYEEYAMHYDPLDLHGASGNYDPEGIPWASEGSGLENKETATSNFWATTMTPFDTPNATGWDITNYYFWGSGSSAKILQTQCSAVKISNEALAPTVFHYCTGKNKRNVDGNIDQSKLRWFVPGISELESVLARYNNNYLGFNKNFYWSANPAKRKHDTWSVSSVIYPEQSDRARATHLNENGSHISSGSTDNTDNYPNGGRTLRTQKLRVRAIRTADGVTN